MTAILHSTSSEPYNLVGRVVGRMRAIPAARKSSPRNNLRKIVAHFSLVLYLVVGNAVFAGCDGMLTSRDESMVESPNPNCCGCSGGLLTDGRHLCVKCLAAFDQFVQDMMVAAADHAESYIRQFSSAPLPISEERITAVVRAAEKSIEDSLTDGELEISEIADSTLGLKLFC